MTRKEHIQRAALRISNDDNINEFVAGAEWADQNPAEDYMPRIVHENKMIGLREKIHDLENKLRVAYLYLDVLEIEIPKETLNENK